MVSADYNRWEARIRTEFSGFLYQIREHFDIKDALFQQSQAALSRREQVLQTGEASYQDRVRKLKAVERDMDSKIQKLNQYKQNLVQQAREQLRHLSPIRQTTATSDKAIQTLLPCNTDNVKDSMESGYSSGCPSSPDKSNGDRIRMGLSGLRHWDVGRREQSEQPVQARKVVTERLESVSVTSDQAKQPGLKHSPPHVLRLSPLPSRARKALVFPTAQKRGIDKEFSRAEHELIPTGAGEGISKDHKHVLSARNLNGVDPRNYRLDSSRRWKALQTQATHSSPTKLHSRTRSAERGPRYTHSTHPHTRRDLLYSSRSFDDLLDPSSGGIWNPSSRKPPPNSGLDVSGPERPEGHCSLDDIDFARSTQQPIYEGAADKRALTNRRSRSAGTVKPIQRQRQDNIPRSRSSDILGGQEVEANKPCFDSHTSSWSQQNPKPRQWFPRGHFGNGFKDDPPEMTSSPNLSRRVPSSSAQRSRKDKSDADVSGKPSWRENFKQFWKGGKLSKDKNRKQSLDETNGDKEGFSIFRKRGGTKGSSARQKHREKECNPASGEASVDMSLGTAIASSGKTVTYQDQRKPTSTRQERLNHMDRPPKIVVQSPYTHGTGTDPFPRQEDSPFSNSSYHQSNEPSISPHPERPKEDLHVRSWSTRRLPSKLQPNTKDQPMKHGLEILNSNPGQHIGSPVRSHRLRQSTQTPSPSDSPASVSDQSSRRVQALIPEWHLDRQPESRRSPFQSPLQENRPESSSAVSVKQMTTGRSTGQWDVSGSVRKSHGRTPPVPPRKPISGIFDENARDERIKAH